MFDKIKNYKNYPLWKLLGDVRALGLLTFGVIVLLVTWSGANVIQTNYGLEKEVSKLDQQNQIQSLENNNLKLGNQFFTTDTYLELMARRQFGLAQPGETLLLVPKSVALSHTIQLASGTKSAAPSSISPHQPTYQVNFEAWMNFFLHRPQASQ